MTRQWTAADVSDELWRPAADAYWGHTYWGQSDGDWKEAVAAIANALNVPPPGEDGECVEVRAAYQVNDDGCWCVFGADDLTLQDMHTEAEDWVDQGCPVLRGTLTARIPIPRPVEVAASVEVQE